MDIINKVSEGDNNIVDIVHRKEVNHDYQYAQQQANMKDGFQIRRAAVDFGVPYITTIQAALLRLMLLRQ